MSTTGFSQGLRRVHDLLAKGHIQALEMYAVNKAQVRIMSDALNASGCVYSVLESSSGEYRFLITATGTRDQMNTCVETLLGY
jgi:hypothetical protein